MKKFLIALLSILLCAPLSRAHSAADVFTPISKYLSQGDVESLSAWFGDSMEISIFNNGAYCSRNQAKQVLKSFFSSHKPSGFEVSHSTEKENMQYAVGTMSSGEDRYLVSVFLSIKDDAFQIRQIAISRRP